MKSEKASVPFSPLFPETLFPGEDDLDRPAYLRQGGLLN
jgi:hypothetical protein